MQRVDLPSSVLFCLLPMKKLKIVVVGCGIVGAMIAYELNKQTDADIVVFDQHQPFQGSTGAALGVLMGAISGKVKGRTWRLREMGIRRYHSLIPELAEQGHLVPFNAQGIVSLCYEADKLSRWESLQAKRKAQGWPLEIWSPAQMKERCPHIAIQRDDGRRVEAAIYSPRDGQVNPVKLGQALVEVARSHGVTFRWNTPVQTLLIEESRCVGVRTNSDEINADWVVLSAGLGSSALSDVVDEPLEMIPVLGQAMKIQMPKAVGNFDFQPVINGDDIQFVPLGEGRYWIGATVEFPEADMAEIEPDADGLETLKQSAAQFCGAIAQAEILETWSGLRPRPVGQPAPVIKPLQSVDNVLIASGHYRNGVLLAPATAQEVCGLVIGGDE